MSTSLETYLIEVGHYESENERSKRSTLINNVKSLAKEWIMEMVEDNEDRKTAIKAIKQYIYPLGSYVLEVMEKDSKLDTIFIAPQFISLEDFLTLFSTKLQQYPNVKQVIAVGVCRTPQIRLILDDTELFISFSNVPIEYLTGRKNISHPNAYEGMNFQNAISLNGYHIIQDILKIIPNRQTFQIALRAIKLWAKQKGFYSRRLGIMGGTSWTILVVYICQRFPTASPSQLIYQFFNIYREWSWPKPVEIKQFIGKNVYVKNLKLFDFEVSRLARDKNALMPILTPSFPRNNSAFRITRSTKSLIVEEFQKGFTICKEIVDRNGDWTALFEPNRFFDKYEQFIVITGNTIENYRTQTYSVIESKIKVLTNKLDDSKTKNFIRRVQALPYSFDSTINDERRIWIIGIKTTDSIEAVANYLRPYIDDFNRTIFEKIEEIPMERNHIEIDVSTIRHEELSTFLPQDAYDQLFERYLN
ncbi:unnamed protein product [Dimorphilus gyrociliatus]|uniref:polynucleotide adenylyltransferase n=1 Tax=Dimorphilus gyrociliatus TaxID=2664684 RepID=A0A7I8V5Q5_9ANNE|nr:unnamed protein product [Dimorphilus gyrociliatus]